MDALNGRVIGRIVTDTGPSKVIFSPDGEVAYVNHIQSATVSIIDVSSRSIIDTVSGLADIFSSDMVTSPDGTRLWVVHKMIGKMTVIDLTTQSTTVIDTGTESNHPTFSQLDGTTWSFQDTL